jgi:hypothetical protein
MRRACVPDISQAVEKAIERNRLLVLLAAFISLGFYKFMNIYGKTGRTNRAGITLAS